MKSLYKKQKQFTEITEFARRTQRQFFVPSVSSLCPLCSQSGCQAPTAFGSGCARLGYGDPVPVRASGTGTLTWIAAEGSTVMRGEPLFKVDELPVVALYGAVPMYRTLRNRVMGADVWQLQENLLELGYTGFAADGIYTQATATAVLAWQADLGLSQTGMVNLGQVVFTPGPARIAEHVAGVGDLLGNDSAHILNYTNTTRIVTVALNVVHQALAVEGGQSRLRCPTSARWKVSLPRLARWSRQMSLKSR
jgi:hypothetical protein